MASERESEFLILKKVKGVNTQPSREALAPDEYAWLENIMPIGDAFLKAVPAQATATATITGTVSVMHPATIGTTNYQICFTMAGGAQAVNLSSGSVVQIFASGALSGTPAMDQWKSERIVVAASNGMFSWDGTLSYSPGSIATISVYVTGSGFTSTPTVTFTGGGGTGASAVATLSGGGIGAVNLVTVGSGFTSAPAIGFSGGGGTGATASAFIMPTGMGGEAISVYSGRVWVALNRTLNFTAPNTWYDVATANAAGSSTITEGSLRTKIYGTEALDNYLYVFGDASIIAIGDVKVSGSVTTFSQTFLSSTTGTTLPATITSMERAVIFANREGVYALFGASLQKISNPLDGIFPDIDFSTVTPSGGLAAIYNILCYVLSFRYTGDVNARQLQALYFNGKWFFTSQGDGILFVSPIQRNGIHELWCSSGQDVRRMYADTSADITQTLQTGLYDLGNPVFDKLVLTAGIEYTAPSASALTLQIDTESQTTSTSSTTGSTLTWYNASGQEIDWRNNANAEITWLSTSFLLDYFAAAISGKYLGATVMSTSPQLEINGILMEYKRQAAWGR